MWDVTKPRGKGFVLQEFGKLAIRQVHGCRENAALRLFWKLSRARSRLRATCRRGGSEAKPAGRAFAPPGSAGPAQGGAGPGLGGVASWRPRPAPPPRGSQYRVREAGGRGSAGEESPGVGGDGGWGRGGGIGEGGEQRHSSPPLPPSPLPSPQ